MFSLKIKLSRFLALGAMFALSLITMLAILVIIASAQEAVPRARPWTEPEARRSPQQDTVMRLEPAVAIVGNGEVFRISFMIDNAQGLGAFEFVMDYNPAVIEVLNQPKPVALGPFLVSTGRPHSEYRHEIDPATGVITYGVCTLGPTPPGPDGDGLLAFVDLRARALDTTALDLRDVKLRDIAGNTQDVSVSDGLVVVAAPPDAAVSIQKGVDPLSVAPQGVLTYTVQRSFSFTGQHSYNEIVFDPIPTGTTYLAGSATWNGLPAPELYSGTLDTIYREHSGVFTDTDQWTLTFQVRVGSLPSGTLVANIVTETTSFDGNPYKGPYVGTSDVTVTHVCTEVTGVDLTLLTAGDIYTDTPVAFRVDISPDDANKPYSYTIDYDDGTAPVAGTSSDDPMTLNHTFATAGTHTVEIAVWNCTMTAMEPKTDTADVVVNKRFWIYLPILMRNY